MAPTLTGPATAIYLAEAELLNNKQQKPHIAKNVSKPTIKESEAKDKPYVYKVELVWQNIFAFIFLHVGALYGIYLSLSGQVKLLTILFGSFVSSMGALGITGGAHRLWAHKSYKARWPLRVILAIWQTVAFQNDIYEWVRDHRVHHKFCDTDADPHNSKRGFFFSHMGWLCCRKHRDVIEKGKTIDMSDLEKDWVVMFQKKYYLFFMPLFCFILPSWLPTYLWNENGWVSFWTAGIMRYVLSLNFTWLVNSAAHMWGDKPYDQNLSAKNNLTVGILAFGEGWHNYHHAFPWDYKTSELLHINFTTKFLKLMGKIGWAYDMKEASDEIILKRARRTGDGTRKDDVSTNSKHNNNNNETDDNLHEGEVWGWDDKDMTNAEKSMVHITYKKLD